MRPRRPGTPGSVREPAPHAPATIIARLLGFLAAVFLVKFIVVLQLHDHPLLQPDAGLDTSAYVALAGRVRAGDLLLGPGLYFVSPLYIYFLAASLAIDDSFSAVRVLHGAKPLPSP